MSRRLTALVIAGYVALASYVLVDALAGVLL
jgi:hypothetical protein